MTTNAVLQGELLPPAEGTPLNQPARDEHAAVTVQLVPDRYADMDKERGVLLQASIPPIASLQDRDVVNAMRLRALAFIKQYKPKFDDVCRDAKSAHTKACELRDLFIGGVERFEADCARLITSWESQEARLRRDRELAEQAKAQAEEKERIAREAKLRASMGDKEGAKAILAMPVQAPPVVTQPAPPKATGLSKRTDWKWRPVTGDNAVGREMAAKVLPRQFLMIDAVKLNAHAETTKGTVPVPGIEFFAVDVPLRR